MTNAHWLDILPAIPLARGVPVRGAPSLNYPNTGVVIFASGNEVQVLWDGSDSESIYKMSSPHDLALLADTTRVDLDDPQGFAYGLRWLVRYRRRAALAEHQRDAAAVANAWLWNEVITDADRLALARALAEVS